jgi:gas vesicle protein
MKKVHRTQETVMPSQTRREAKPLANAFLSGLFLGGLAGAGAMLLLAPRSGKRTRARIQHQVEDLRDQVTEGMEDAEEEVLAQARRVAANVRGKMKEMQHGGHVLFEK